MASLLYGLAGKLLGELSSPFLKDVGKSWAFGTKDEFEKLKNTLSVIEAVLLDAEEKQRTNHQVQDWLKKIKLVFYDVEDLLQEFSTEALKRQVMTKNKTAKEVHLFFSSSNPVLYRLKMGRKVQLIRERLDAIALDRNRFNFTEQLVEMHLINNKMRKETHSFVPLEKVIGIDEDTKSATKLLFESDPERNVSVISIIGIGGMGKTTLAQSVYNSKEVQNSFELMMWVSVSNVFDVKLICENIIESATKRKCKRFHMDGVKDELKEAIDGRRYLLVLDDVWNENPIEWMNLEELLIGGAKGSKILITARAALVALASNSTATYILKGLSHEKSWFLFKQVASKPGAKPWSSRMEGIGKEVLERCGGVPLAIKTIGSMLGLKEGESDWINFGKNDLQLITQDTEGGIVPILKLSYDYLSALLKRCFAYCAMFPKQFPIDRLMLIRLWMAQGFVQLDSRTTQCLEDVGDQYFMELVNRSFLEVHTMGSDGHVLFCKMHDLIHDLAQSMGGKECFNVGWDLSVVDETCRHAWVPLHRLPKLFNAKKLRTLVVMDIWKVGFQFNKIKCICTHLRVLDLADLKIKIVPSFIGGLTNLNYLNLSRNTFDILPESISDLYKLQTLILISCKKLKELPPRMRNLVSLRYLDIGGCNKLTHMPRGLGELTCLHALSDFIIGPEGSDCSELGELESLVNLRGRLTIRNLRGFSKGGRTSHHLLTQMQFLRSLVLEWSIRDEAKEDEEAELMVLESLKPHSSLVELCIGDYGGERFPSWMNRMNIGVSLPNIVCIQIRNFRLDSSKGWRQLPPFGLLPCLQELSLCKMGFIEYMYWGNEEEEDCASSSSSSSEVQLFPSLRKLSLGYMPKLTREVGPRAMSRPNRHFPVLDELYVDNCPLSVADSSDEARKQFMSLTSLRVVHLCGSSDMVTLPAWLQCLSNLQTLELFQCPNIVALPPWMSKLTSLQKISLKSCHSLASIPRLTSLRQLIVHNCPTLGTRCDKETGEDWHKISHIPTVQVTAGWGIYMPPDICSTFQDKNEDRGILYV